jgi:hypothetical protein
MPSGAPLRLVGTDADRGRRDASRLLASVALLVQQITDVDTEPVLAPADAHGLARTAAGARVVLVGLPDGWRERGIGRTRAELARRCDAPVLLLRGFSARAVGRPEGLTRYTWTLARGSR